MLWLKFFLITQARVQNAVKHLWFGVFLVHIFPHLDWIRRNTSYLSVLNPNVGNTDQKNSEYGHFLRSEGSKYNPGKPKLSPSLIFF